VRTLARMDHTGELLLGLMVAVVVLSVVARWLGKPYPIMLVIGGLLLGFFPGLPDVHLDPDMVLLVFLPPLLYGAAIFTSLRELIGSWRPIALLSVGLVILTTCAVAVVAHALIPSMPWAAAFVLGAVVAPTDALAATSIARKLGVPRRLVSVIEGESLLNDGTALTVYAVAVTAVVSGTFSASHAGLDFVVDTTGGVLIGLAVGWLAAAIRERLDDPLLEVTISLATGYAAYLPAEALGLSGILAAVTAGIYLAWRAPVIASPGTRMRAFAVWETVTFLLNAFLFILIGLQLPVVLDGLQSRSASELVAYAAGVIAAVVGARLLWGFTVVYMIRVLDPRLRDGRLPRSTWQGRLVIAWAGMRGAVSLAAALALPLTTDSGASFPERDLIIFLSFAVILFTLVVQGLTLPALIRRLGIEEDDAEEREEFAARIAAAEAALARLEELGGEEWARDDTVDRMRGLYNYRRRRFAARADGDDTDGIEERAAAYQRLIREVLNAQRDELLRLRNRREISDDVMRRVQRDLDLEDQRLEI
jgi:monovalent cation/hydrogen antiporter